MKTNRLQGGPSSTSPRSTLASNLECLQPLRHESQEDPQDGKKANLCSQVVLDGISKDVHSHTWIVVPLALLAKSPTPSKQIHAQQLPRLREASDVLLNAL